MMMSVAANYNPSLDEPHVVTASYHPSCQWRNRVLSYSIYRPIFIIGQGERLGQLAQAHIFAST